MTIEKWTVLGIGLGAVIGFAALGFASMSTNSKVPSWVAVGFFVIATIAGILTVIYIISPVLQGRINWLILISGSILIILGIVMVSTQLHFKGGLITPQSAQVEEPQSSVFPIFAVPKQTQYLVFSYGNSSFRFTMEELLSGGRKFFTANNYEPFKAYIVSENSSDNLYVDVNTYGNNTFPPLQIVRNQLISLPQGWDVNFLNGYALELVNDKQEPILQLIYDNQYHIIVKGFVTYPNGIAYTDGVTTYVAQGSPDSTIDPILLQKSPLQRLFKYPSSTNLHILNK